MRGEEHFRAGRQNEVPVRRARASQSGGNPLRRAVSRQELAIWRDGILDERSCEAGACGWLNTSRRARGCAHAFSDQNPKLS